jgi:hypothetical protein
MNPLTCQDVEARIELYAAGECDEPERVAIEQHLTGCPACSRAKDEAEGLAGLLDVHFGAVDRLQRLHARLEAEDRPSAVRHFGPVLRRLTALAALLLLTAGLLWSIRPLAPSAARGGQGLVAVALLPQEWALAEKEEGVQAVVGSEPQPLRGHPNGQAKELTFAPVRLPAPPKVNLGLKLRNTSDKEMHLQIGSAGSELQLDLQGPGAVSVPARDGLGEAFLTEEVVTLAPGEEYALPIHRLVYGSRNNVRYAYWTEPGEYTLTARYTAALSSTRRARAGEPLTYVTLDGVPSKIRVVAKP